MNADLNQVANSMLGIPFSQLGRKVEDGLDCIGCLMVFYEKAFGIILPSQIHLGWKEIASPMPGDVAEIRAYQDRFVDHVAILLPGDMLLHSVQGAGVVRTKRRVYAKRIARWITRDRNPSDPQSSSPSPNGPAS